MPPFHLLAMNLIVVLVNLYLAWYMVNLLMLVSYFHNIYTVHFLQLQNDLLHAERERGGEIER